MCIGKHRYKRESDVVLAMWQRVSPASYRRAMRRNNARTEDDILQDLVEASSQVREVVDGAARARTTSSVAVAECYRGALTRLEQTTQLDGQAMQVVRAAVRKNLNTGYGTRLEPEMLSHIRDAMHIPCRADPTLYQKLVGEVHGVPWYVCGRVDAISDDRTMVVEIKNRVRRLLYRAPAWEALQVQAYMELLDLPRGALIECYKPNDGDVQTNVIPLSRDRQLWQEDVVPKLARFVGFLLSLVRDTALQDRFLRSPEPWAMVLADPVT